MTMLYRETAPDDFAPWHGEMIDEVRYPPNIAELWSAEDLARLGLFRPAPAAKVPYGKDVVATSVQRVEGVVRYVHELADAPLPALADYSAAVQALLDGAARARDYADIVSAVSYSASTIQRWAQEGAAFGAWRDAVWAKAYDVLDEVNTGSRPQPSVEAFIAELPVLNLPG